MREDVQKYNTGNWKEFQKPPTRLNQIKNIPPLKSREILPAAPAIYSVAFLELVDCTVAEIEPNSTFAISREIERHAATSEAHE